MGWDGFFWCLWNEPLMIFSLRQPLHPSLINHWKTTEQPTETRLKLQIDIRKIGSSPVTDILISFFGFF